jgi:hypothetical protein
MQQDNKLKNSVGIVVFNNKDFNLDYLAKFSFHINHHSYSIRIEYF